MQHRFVINFRMTWEEIQPANREGKPIEVTIINPLRKESCYSKGKLTGYKGGLPGDIPKVHVAYYNTGLQEIIYGDWIPVDNCTFELIK